ncbi:Protein SRT-44, partial [Aphelenchoides avenae]
IPPMPPHQLLLRLHLRHLRLDAVRDAQPARADLRPVLLDGLPRPAWTHLRRTEPDFSRRNHQNVLRARASERRHGPEVARLRPEASVDGYQASVDEQHHGREATFDGGRKARNFS